jgi:3'-5' exoribonuclease
MKSIYVGTLVPNEVVTAHFLVISKEIKQKKSGEPYLSLQLSDRTGDIEAKMWDNVSEVMATFDRDDFIKVKGLAQSYQNRLQFTVHRLRRLEDHEVEFEDFFPCAERPGSEMFAELQAIISGIRDEHLRQLLTAVFADEAIASRFQIAPAAKNIHHACRGGLLEHVLSLCRLCQVVGPHYKQVDVDLLLTGAILHDIGKVEELTYARSFGYSPEGQLLGHIVIGLRLVGEKMSSLPGLPPKLRTLVEHLILSHHGELEFGSPRVPLFPEALLLHHLDNLDSKMEAMRRALAREGDGDFTGWIGALERNILRKSRYLDGSAAVVSPKQQALVDPVDEGFEASVAIEVEPEKPAVLHPVAETVIPPAAKPMPAHPGPPSPQPQPPPRQDNRHDRSQSMTLFGEKLQAVLDPRK